ncbi:hypothetical protein PUN28_005020 [Cardiocondyla obscurior]|uniref:ATP synthase F0 subunit 8 n=1 Tax=Cardiocondyla obscurior TaxID=286306 RepID=A0AAW2GIT9_9HYME
MQQLFTLWFPPFFRHLLLNINYCAILALLGFICRQLKLFFLLRIKSSDTVVVKQKDRFLRPRLVSEYNTVYEDRKKEREREKKKGERLIFLQFNLPFDYVVSTISASEKSNVNESNPEVAGARRMSHSNNHRFTLMPRRRYERRFVIFNGFEWRWVKGERAERWRQTRCPRALRKPREKTRLVGKSGNDENAVCWKRKLEKARLFVRLIKLALP